MFDSSNPRGRQHAYIPTHVDLDGEGIHDHQGALECTGLDEDRNIYDAVHNFLHCTVHIRSRGECGFVRLTSRCYHFVDQT